QYVSGHGMFAPFALEELRNKNPKDRRFYEEIITVPEGTSVSFWNPDKSELLNDFGAGLERGSGNLAQALQGRRKQQHHMEVFGPGAKLKNYILGPGSNLAMGFSLSRNIEHAKEPQTLAEIFYRHRGKNIQWM